jgi:hypothetical protein
MKGQEQGTCPWQPGPGFVYVKLGELGENRRFQVSFMKPRRLEQERCFQVEGIVSQA